MNKNLDLYLNIKVEEQGVIQVFIAKLIVLKIKYIK